MATPLNPDQIVVDSFPTVEDPSISSVPGGGMSDPPMICSCFGSSNIDSETRQLFNEIITELRSEGFSTSNISSCAR